MKNDSLDFNIVSVYFIILVHNSVNETLWKNIWKSRLCNWNFRKNSIFLESFRINLWNSWVRIKAIRISFLLCVCVCAEKCSRNKFRTNTKESRKMWWNGKNHNFICALDLYWLQKWHIWLIIFVSYVVLLRYKYINEIL